MWIEYQYKHPYSNEIICDYFETDCESLSEACFDLKSSNYHKGHIMSWRQVPGPSKEYCMILRKALQTKLDAIDREMSRLTEYMNDIE